MAGRHADRHRGRRDAARAQPLSDKRSGVLTAHTAGDLPPLLARIGQEIIRQGIGLDSWVWRRDSGRCSADLHTARRHQLASSCIA